MRTILICGTRNYYPLEFANNLMTSVINNYIGEDDLVIHGGALGIDTLANSLLIRSGHFNIEVIKPNYEKYGKIAPLKRDEVMVSKADWVLAFWNGTSSGTRYTILNALENNKKVAIFPLGFIDYKSFASLQLNMMHEADLKTEIRKRGYTILKEVKD